MKTVMTVAIIVLALICCFLGAACLWLEKRRFDAELRLEEKEELLDFFHVDLMDSDDEEDLE